MAIIINVKVKDSPDVIEGKILSSLRDQIDKAFRGSVSPIRKRIQDLCVALIQDTEEYDSLLSGELLAELGIPDVGRRLRQILEAVRKGVTVTAKAVTVRGKNLTGGMEIGMVKSDFEDLVRLPAAQYVSNGRYLIPWLEWLLVEGDRIIVLTHEVTFTLSPEDRARSRTGMALMRPGRGWRVDPRYSGVAADNFITRAFNGSAIADTVAAIVREEIQKRV
jgi:hypothetical protein